MKMTPEHYAILEKAIRATEQRFPDARAIYAANGWSAKRYRWDLLWASNELQEAQFVQKCLYPYINDEHIDSALRRIVERKAR